MSRVVHPQVRSAVRDCLSDLSAGDLVQVACSGGPDSLALAAVTAQVGHERGLVTHGVIVDHGLQTDSAAVAQRAAAACRAVGVDRTEVIAVRVGVAGGPEAAAREARYAALQSCAELAGAATVLLGHTMDDQAETVLLRLARGSGARSLAAMAPRQGIFRRPLLALRRSTVLLACQQALEPLGLQPWRDPQNADPRFSRVRVRLVLANLEEALGPGVVPGLARTAYLLRDDADLVESLAQEWLAEHPADVPGLDVHVNDLNALPRAVRTRVLRAGCLAAGCPPADLDLDHVLQIERLITDWHGQGEIALPGQVRARRAYGRLRIHGRR